MKNDAEIEKLKKLAEGIEIAYNSKTIFDGYILMRKAWQIYKGLPQGTYWCDRDKKGNMHKRIKN